MHYIIYFIYLINLYLLTHKKKYYKTKSYYDEKTIILIKSNKKKPLWVKEEIIKLKAIDKNLSHRIIAEIFNSKFENESVSKTCVGYTLKNYHYEILEMRKNFKNKKPYDVKFNSIWGTDLTFINRQPILGIIEHNSRKCLELIPLRQKSSVAVLKALLTILEKYPKPNAIRTDNEIVFKSKLMKFGLWFLNIRHQTTDLNSPWQNGRIERLFGTFKNTLALSQYDKDDLGYLTYSFQWWYNNIRFHQNLDYETPEYIYQRNINEFYKERYDE
jgi:hypothetical protein